jgi:hypothetical protein
MTFPTNYFSVHMIKVISARAMPGNPAVKNSVVITVKGHYTDTEISLHIDNAEYAQRLAAAINGAVNAGELNEL